MHRIGIVFLASALAVLTAPGSILHVPGQFATIQAAIDAANDGDTVLVAPGRYPENITFRTKNIVVAGTYILTSDPASTLATVIDGSSPSHPDSASCVRIVGGQDTTAVLEGFTLTGGRGTKWQDEHGAGLYREGGGVLTALSSPTIRNNVLIANEAINSAGCVSAGGGAMRLGDGSPRVLNNVIVLNRAMYGGGIVLNYCSGAIIRNNIIHRNRVYPAVPGVITFGGGGIWINNRLPASSAPNLVENNTIISNSSEGDGVGPAGRGGAFHLQVTNVTARNNIVWANRQSFGGQINGPLTLSHSCIEGGYAGPGNIDLFPGFVESGFSLAVSSPCVDAGDPAAAFNDPEDAGTPGNATPPARGTTHNDMGAFGGPLARRLPEHSDPGISVSPGPHDFGLLLPGQVREIPIPVASIGASRLSVDSVAIVRNESTALQSASPLPFLVTKATSQSLHLRWSPSTAVLLDDTVLIYHNDPHTTNPVRAALAGSSIATPLLTMSAAEHNFGSIDVNVPTKDTTFYLYNQGTGEDSVALSIDPKNVNPVTAMDVSPPAATLAPGDSLAITFTFRPRDIIKSGLGLYAPVVILESRTTSAMLQSTMRFRLTGTVGVTEPAGVPDRLTLDQNYPNPFNPTTTIGFHVPALTAGTGGMDGGVPGLVKLAVYDALGREVAVLVNERMAPGSHSVGFDASGLASGTYLYQLTAGPAREAKRMVVVK
jgi:hypothetical protein